MKIRKTAFILILLAILCTALSVPVLAYDNYLFEITIDGEFSQVGDSYLWLSSDRQASLSITLNDNTNDLNVNQMSMYDLDAFQAGFLTGINGHFSSLLSEDTAFDIVSIKTELKDLENGRAATVDCYATCYINGQDSDVRLYSCTYSSQNYVYTVTLTALDSTLYQQGVFMAESIEFFDEPSNLMLPFWVYATIIYYIVFIFYGVIVFAFNVLIVVAVLTEHQRRKQIRKAVSTAILFNK